MENRIEDAIVLELNKIGVPPTAWLTVPGGVTLGPPGDPVPAKTAAKLYLQWIRTEPLPPAAGTSQHWARAHWGIWCASSAVNGLRLIKDLKADVLRALFAAEPTLIALTGYGLWPDGFLVRDDLSSIAVAIGVQLIYTDFLLDHTNP
jgi:hypothetical protein